MARALFLEATVNEEFEAKTFKGTSVSLKKRLKVEEGNRAEAFLGDAVVLVGAVAEKTGGVMGSVEMKALRSVLDKRQLARKPFYQKIKELVRDVTQLLERGEFLKSFLGHAASLVKWKHTSPEPLVAEVARMAAVLAGACAYLQDVVCKVCYELIQMLVLRHYQPVTFVAYGSIAVLFCTFRSLQADFGALVSVLRSYHAVAGFSCAMPELPAVPAPAPLSSTRADEQFLDLCSFGRPYMLNHNLGGGEDNDDDVADEVAVRAAIAQSTWVDDSPVAPPPLQTASTAEQQMEEWLRAKESQPPAPAGQAARRKQKRQEEAEVVPSNSFFSEFEQQAKKPHVKKPDKSNNKSNKNNKSEGPSKQSFLAMLRK
jgi:hypothetical protein